MVPQEPIMEEMRKTPSPSGTSSAVAESPASATRSNNLTELQQNSKDELPISSSTGGVDQSPAEEDTTRQSIPSESESDRPFPVPSTNNNNKQSQRIPGDAQSGGGSDVERFDGKIVYNPDGSAYIIEDSELSGEDDTSLDVPHLEGCIVDGRGISLSQIPAIPQIANAFYVSRNPALYNALYGGQAYSSLLQDKKIVPEIPIMHSYRVKK